MPSQGGVVSELEARYVRWSRAHEASGAGLHVALGFAKGISEGAPLLSGQLVIERDGSLEAQIAGLDEAADLWLIDNEAGSGPLYDPGDEAHLVGRIEPAAGGATAQLRVRLGAGFADSPLDRVLLCRAGAGPDEGILLTGSPSTFARLHASGTSPDALASLAAEGRRLFEAETFAGNGRTCATCHPSLNNFTIDPAFIATLPDDDPLFIAEQVPALAQLENPLLMRTRGLILENLDGFERPGTMRGVPHMLGLSTSITGPAIPFDNTLNPPFGVMPPAERTGWSGEGAPGSGSLREFAIGAVVQHFPLTLARVEGEDFRLPTDVELDALEIFQLSLGRQQEVKLAELAFRDPIVAKGRELFERLDTEGGSRPAAKCALCHSQAGANIDPTFFSDLLGAAVSGNANFGTGVNDLAALPADLLDREGNPRDGGFARVPHDGSVCEPARGGFGGVTPEGGILPPGLCEEDFNTPPLVEAADTGPFFHNNAVDTLEAAVGFYNDRAFNESAGGQILASLDSGGIGIQLDSSEVSAVASLLRTLNALENIRVARSEAIAAGQRSQRGARALLARALAEERDAREVLMAGLLSPAAIAALVEAEEALHCASRAHFSHFRRRSITRAVEALDAARSMLVADDTESASQPQAGEDTLASSADPSWVALLVRRSVVVAARWLELDASAVQHAGELGLVDGLAVGLERFAEPFLDQ
jgi:cytochrome c peroxidase